MQVIQSSFSWKANIDGNCWSIPEERVWRTQQGCCQECSMSMLGSCNKGFVDEVKRSPSKNHAHCMHSLWPSLWLWILLTIRGVLTELHTHLSKTPLPWMHHTWSIIFSTWQLLVSCLSMGFWVTSIHDRQGSTGEHQHRLLLFCHLLKKVLEMRYCVYSYAPPSSHQQDQRHTHTHTQLWHLVLHIQPLTLEIANRKKFLSWQSKAVYHHHDVI